jgi:hypothetical protein
MHHKRPKCRSQSTRHTRTGDNTEIYMDARESRKFFSLTRNPDKRVEKRLRFDMLAVLNHIQDVKASVILGILLGKLRQRPDENL